jgi:hypothetical protein
MAKGRTLWEMLTARLQGPVEFRYYNPLHARVGTSVMINEIDWKDDNFFIREIREYRRTIGGKEFVFADYVLLARPLGKDDIWVRLRLLPLAEPDPAGGLTHDALLLRLDDEMAYDEDFHKVVTDTTKKFQVLEDGQVTEEYCRINDVTEPYKAKLTVIKDTNSDSRVDPDEVETVSLEYWDYWREVKDEAGQPLRQYLFVEMDARTGWFQIWKGQEVDPQRVLVI